MGAITKMKISLEIQNIFFSLNLPELSTRKTKKQNFSKKFHAIFAKLVSKTIKTVNVMTIQFQICAKNYEVDTFKMLISLKTASICSQFWSHFKVYTF
jgi:hypothetical protein